MNKNKLFKKALYCLVPAVTLGTFLTCQDYISKQETVIKVNNHIRDKFYNEEQISDNSYEDTSMTLERLNVIKGVTMNLKYDSIDDVYHAFNDLSTVEIYNAQLLTDDDIDIINKAGTETIKLHFDYKEVLANREEHFDLSRFDNKPVVYYQCKNEYQIMVLREYLDYMDNKYDQFIGMLDDQQVSEGYIYNNMYEDVTDIYNSLFIEDDMDDYEKIYIILKYLSDTYSYDPDVADVTTLREQKRDYYNKYPVSSMIYSDSHYAICQNYAVLFDLLAYKAGVKSRVVSGEKSDGNSHAWNVVEIDGKRYFVDPTNTTKIKLSVMKEYMDTTQDYNDLIMKKIVLSEVSDEYKNYKVRENIDELFGVPNNVQYDVKYYNTNIEGEKVINKPLNTPRNALIALASSPIGLLAYELINKKKRSKTSLSK